jgi:hypothetical protein
MNMGTFGFWIFLAVAVAVAMWTHLRKLQMRKDLIQSLLEKGQPIDIEQINQLLEPKHAHPQFGPPDPRSPYRAASYMLFFVGFITLFVALKQDTPLYLLALLSALPLYLAVNAWRTCNREYADGTLATLKYGRDPREHWQQGGGWAFWLGYVTSFMAIYKYDLNIPLLGIGLVAIFIAFRIWADGEHQYTAGKIPVNAPDPDTKPEQPE